MTQQRLALGAQGEELAAQLLQRKGLRVLERNLRTPVGEIDILARSRTHLVFVEVKTRRGTGYGHPAEAVGPRKQRQIIRAAQWILAGRGRERERLQPRFDVVAVILEREAPPRLEHLENAFGVGEHG